MNEQQNTNFGTAAVAAMLLRKKYEFEDGGCGLFSVDRTAQSWKFSVCIAELPDIYGRYHVGVFKISASAAEGWTVRVGVEGAEDQSWAVRMTQEYEGIFSDLQADDESHRAVLISVVEHIPEEELGADLTLDYSDDCCRVYCADKRMQLSVVKYPEKAQQVWLAMLGGRGCVHTSVDSTHNGHVAGQLQQAIEKTKRFAAAFPR